MNSDLMKDAAKYYTEAPEGVAYMYRTFEEIRKEGLEQGAEQARIDSIRNLMDSLKMTAQQAMEVLKIPASEQSAYAAKL